MAFLDVQFRVDAGQLVATVNSALPAAGNIGIANGLALRSQIAGFDGNPVDVTLGAVVPGVFQFHFELLSETFDSIAILSNDALVQILPVNGSETALGAAPTDATIAAFLAGITAARITDALRAELGDWIRDHIVVGAGVLVTFTALTLTTGGIDIGALLAATELEDGAAVATFVTGLIPKFISSLVDREVADGVLGQGDADAIKAWTKVATFAVDWSSAMKSEADIAAIAGGLSAITSLVSENDAVTLTVSYQKDLVGRTVLLLKLFNK
jgi:hypothetical protein